MIFLFSFDCCKNLLIEKWNFQRKFKHQDTIQLKILLIYSIRHRFQRIAEKKIEKRFAIAFTKTKKLCFFYSALHKSLRWSRIKILKYINDERFYKFRKFVKMRIATYDESIERLSIYDVDLKTFISRKINQEICKHEFHDFCNECNLNNLSNRCDDTSYEKRNVNQICENSQSKSYSFNNIDRK